VAGKGFGQNEFLKLKKGLCPKMKNGIAFGMTIEHWDEGFEILSKFDERFVQEHLVLRLQDTFLEAMRWFLVDDDLSGIADFLSNTRRIPDEQGMEDRRLDCK
jgi:hypothetical protein